MKYVCLLLFILFFFSCTSWSEQTAKDVAIPVAREINQCMLKCAAYCVTKKCQAIFGKKANCTINSENDDIKTK